MLYLPRLFVYHCAAEKGPVQLETFKERRLLRLAERATSLVERSLPALQAVYSVESPDMGAHERRRTRRADPKHRLRPDLTAVLQKSSKHTRPGPPPYPVQSAAAVDLTA
jgi:hypothetical protein